MQKLYLGADHGGFEYKEAVKQALHERGFEVVDVGAHQIDAQDDYPEFAFAVAEAVKRDLGAGSSSFGILFCRSGAGMEIAANKISGIRAVRAETAESARAARAHNDANVLSIAADYTPQELVLALILAFIETPFSGEERHHRRIAQITKYETTTT